MIVVPVGRVRFTVFWQNGQTGKTPLPFFITFDAECSSAIQFWLYRSHQALLDKKVVCKTICFDSECGRSKRWMHKLYSVVLTKHHRIFILIKMAFGTWREMLKFNVQHTYFTVNNKLLYNTNFCTCCGQWTVTVWLFVSLESVLVKKVSLFLFSCNGYDLKLWYVL